MKHNSSSFARAIHLCAFFSGAMTALLVLWQRLAPSELILALAITSGTFFYHFFMRLAVGAAIPALFKSRLQPESGWFRSRSLEQKIYRCLNVRRWKGKMPTYDPREFSLEENTLEEIIRNSCNAELVHECIMVLSFLPVAVIPLWGEAGVFWSTSVLAAMGDGIFVIMQRYNRPRLERLAKRRGTAHGKI